MPRFLLPMLILTACDGGGVVVEATAEAVVAGTYRVDCPAGDITRDIWQILPGAVYNVWDCEVYSDRCTAVVPMERGGAIDLNCDGRDVTDRFYRVRYIAPL